MDNYENKNKRESKRFTKPRKFFATCLITLTVAMLIALIVELPMFRVTNTVINGLDNLTAVDVAASMNLSASRSVFTVVPQIVERDIRRANLPYLKDVSVSIDFPDTVIVEVTERRPRAYVRFDSPNALVLVDDEGFALETTGFPDKRLPVIVGLDSSGFTVGQRIEAPGGIFRDVIMIGSVLYENGMDPAMEVDLSDRANIRVMIGGVEVNFGTMANANEKIRTAIACIQELPSGARGFLDVGSSADRAVFRHLS